MAKKNLTNPSHVLIFVEGDTDEVFFKALIDFYASVSSNKLLPYDVCNLKGVTRYSSKLLAKLKNEYLPTAQKGGYRIKTVCCSYDTENSNYFTKRLKKALQHSAGRLFVGLCMEL